MIDVRNFGAAGNGESDDTAALQAAIDKGCAGQETVLIPAGVYLVGTLILKSHTHLEIASGACLQGHSCIDAYRGDDKPGFHHYILWGKNAEDISIAGTGTVDGAGAAFWENHFFDGSPDIAGDMPADPCITKVLKPKTVRPCVIYLENCRNISLKDFTIRNSPAYTVWLLGCEQADIRHVTVRNPRKGPNTDVMDIDCSSDVVIADCDLRAGDDCIALKSDSFRLGRAKTCERITVENCRLSSSTCAVRIGYEGDAPIRDCVFRNLEIADTRHGINITSISPGNLSITEIRYGTPVGNIRFENINMHNVMAAFYFWAGKGVEEAEYRGCIRDIVLEHLRATQVGASYIGSRDEAVVGNITFTDVAIEQKSPLKMTVSPDYLPCNWASRELGAVLNFRHVTGIVWGRESVISAPPDTLQMIFA